FETADAHNSDTADAHSPHFGGTGGQDDGHLPATPDAARQGRANADEHNSDHADQSPIFPAAVNEEVADQPVSALAIDAVPEEGDESSGWALLVIAQALLTAPAFWAVGMRTPASRDGKKAFPLL